MQATHLRATTLLSVLVVCAARAFAATPYALDTARSSLGFTGTQTGAPFEGQFRSFNADIVFSEDDLAHSNFDVTIATKSVDTGEDDRDETIRGDDLFAVNKFPTAKFVATNFTKKGVRQYEATGKLTIRNVTRELKLPFTFGNKGGEAWLKGGVTLKRLDYGVGQGEWQDTSTVANDIKVKFTLRLTPKATAPVAVDQRKQIPKKPDPSTSR